jgi:hypothetical protein
VTAHRSDLRGGEHQRAAVRRHRIDAHESGHRIVIESERICIDEHVRRPADVGELATAGTVDNKSGSSA